MINNLPKISCLCITRNRVSLLKKSIRMFENQTYPDKELVIVYLAIDVATRDFLASVNNARIKSIAVDFDSELTLGDLRNISIAEASGDYICTWDDDDWFHPERLAFQIKGIIGSAKKAGALLNIIMLDNTTGDAYISSKRLWEASIMCERQYIMDNQLVYPSVNKREDTYFLKKINSLDIVLPQRNPKMYIYSYTGMNTCSEAHFKMLFSAAKKLSVSNGELISKLYNQTETDKTMTTLLDAMVLEIA